jgi:predicted acetyltransferase
VTRDLNPQLEIGPPADEAELRALARYASQAFSATPAATPEIGWMEEQGRENFRVVRVGGRVAGGLGLLPLGQWFGGKSVRMAGVNSAVIAPEHRSAGVASRLLRSMLEEMRAAGFPLSALYPSTQPVYRRAGYEQAGVLMRYRQPTSGLPTGDRGATVRPLAEGEGAVMRELYAARARRTAGNLDRSATLWAWLQEGEGLNRYVVERDGAPEGYVVYRQERFPGEAERTVVARDLVALTPEAGRRLLAFLADHRSTARGVVWHGAPAEPLLLHIANRDYTVLRYQQWMLRLIDVPAALAARGYPAALAAELHLEVRDDLLPANDGRLILAVEGGRAEVRAGGAGRIQVDVRGLAPLYSGYLAPLELRAAGHIAGPDADLATLGLVFAGPTPWMPDHF